MGCHVEPVLCVSPDLRQVQTRQSDVTNPERVYLISILVVGASFLNDKNVAGPLFYDVTVSFLFHPPVF